MIRPATPQEQFDLRKKQFARDAQDTSYKPGDIVQVIGYPQLYGTVLEAWRDHVTNNFIVAVDCMDGNERWFSSISIEHCPVQTEEPK